MRQRKLGESERKQLSVEPPQRLVGVWDVHGHGHVFAIVGGDPDPAGLARRQHETGDEPRLLLAHGRRPFVVGPGVVVERQNTGKITVPAQKRQPVELELRSEASLHCPADALGGLRLGHAANVGHQIHRLPVAELFDMPGEVRRRMVGSNDMRLVETVDQQAGSRD